MIAECPPSPPARPHRLLETIDLDKDQLIVAACPARTERPLLMFFTQETSHGGDRRAQVLLDQQQALELIEVLLNFARRDL